MEKEPSKSVFLFAYSIECVYTREEKGEYLFEATTRIMLS